MRFGEPDVPERERPEGYADNENRDRDPLERGRALGVDQTVVVVAEASSRHVD